MIVPCKGPCPKWVRETWKGKFVAAYPGGMWKQSACPAIFLQVQCWVLGGAPGCFHSTLSHRPHNLSGKCIYREGENTLWESVVIGAWGHTGQAPLVVDVGSEALNSTGLWTVDEVSREGPMTQTSIKEFLSFADTETPGHSRVLLPWYFSKCVQETMGNHLGSYCNCIIMNFTTEPLGEYTNMFLKQAPSSKNQGCWSALKGPTCLFPF